MNTQDRVNEKIAKVALKNQEIELASIAELDGFVGALEKALSQIKNNSSKLSKNLRDIDSVIDDLKVNYRTAEANKKAVDQAIKSSEILAKEISKQAKDLGINPREIKNVDKLISLIEEVEGTQENIDSFLNMAKRYI
jgi:ABC-type transporter Mla subunit MlaD